MILLALALGLVAGVLLGVLVARRLQSGGAALAAAPVVLHRTHTSAVIPVAVVGSNGVAHGATAITGAASANGVLHFAEVDVARFARIQTLGELAASLAHELGQPLSAIRSNAQAARRFLAAPNPPMDDVRAILDDIDADDQRAGEVIHGMRALMEHHQVDMASIDVNAIVRTVARLVHGDCVLRRVSIVLDLDEPLPPVRGDQVEIQQVLLNLVVNAFAAMRDTRQRDRRLIVRTRAEPEGVTIGVHDTGTGIAPEDFPKLFEQFFTTKQDGLGMGLSIARSIAEAHGGRIWATNNSDAGATFHVVLPYAPAAREL